MTQIMVIIAAQHAPTLMRSLRAKGMTVAYPRCAQGADPSAKVELFVTAPDSRLQEAYEALASAS